jgi:hypothetical protein
MTGADQEERFEAGTKGEAIMERVDSWYGSYKFDEPDAFLHYTCI